MDLASHAPSPTSERLMPRTKAERRSAGAKRRELLEAEEGMRKELARSEREWSCFGAQPERRLSGKPLVGLPGGMRKALSQIFVDFRMGVKPQAFRKKRSSTK